jgi:hypothetical protein
MGEIFEVKIVVRLAGISFGLTKSPSLHNFRLFVESRPTVGWFRHNISACTIPESLFHSAIRFVFPKEMNMLKKGVIP